MQQGVTLGIIKPHAVKAGKHIEIIDKVIKADLTIKKRVETLISEEQARRLYEPHRDKPFYDEVCLTMTEGKVVLMKIVGDNAISSYRRLMGDTDPKKAAPGTIRKEFGESIDKNAVHGSDSPESAERELEIFQDLLGD